MGRKTIASQGAKKAVNAQAHFIGAKVAAALEDAKVTDTMQSDKDVAEAVRKATAAARLANQTAIIKATYEAIWLIASEARKPQAPPKSMTFLLELALTPDQAEAVLGDLEENFSGVLVRYGPLAAKFWFAVQALRAAGVLGGQRLKKKGGISGLWKFVVPAIPVFLGWAYLEGHQSISGALKALHLLSN